MGTFPGVITGPGGRRTGRRGGGRCTLVTDASAGTGDILPAGPIQALCGALDAAPTHRCSFTSLPTDGHLTCHANQYDRCRAWFDGLTP